MKIDFKLIYLFVLCCAHLNMSKITIFIILKSIIRLARCLFIHAAIFVFLEYVVLTKVFKTCFEFILKMIMKIKEEGFFILPAFWPTTAASEAAAHSFSTLSRIPQQLAAGSPSFPSSVRAGNKLGSPVQMPKWRPAARSIPPLSIVIGRPASLSIYQPSPVCQPVSYLSFF